MTASFLYLTENVVAQEGACPTRSFLRRKLILEMSLYQGIPSSVRDLVRSCISYDFLILPLIIQGKGRPLAGSRWKLQELTPVS